jgi:FKBP-type peptidyl-prolyl cis-trans isomerase
VDAAGAEPGASTKGDARVDGSGTFCPFGPTMRSLLTLALACLLAAPAVVHAQRERLSPDDLDFVEKTWPNAKKTNTGIRYIIEKQGTGEPAKPGDKVAVLYTGKLLNGTLFDRILDPKNPFVFRVRRNFVIEGWDQILQLMRLGEKRLVIIPSEYAYGTAGQMPKIPPDSTLVFEIELIKIERIDE